MARPMDRARPGLSASTASSPAFSALASPADSKPAARGDPGIRATRQPMAMPVAMPGAMVAAIWPVKRIFRPPSP